MQCLFGTALAGVSRYQQVSVVLLIFHACSNPLDLSCCTDDQFIVFQTLEHSYAVVAGMKWNLILGKSNKIYLKADVSIQWWNSEAN